MKIKLLTSLSGEKTYHAGDEIEVGDGEALALINKGIAEPKNKKELADLEGRVAKAKADNEAKQAQIIAIQKDEELRFEALALTKELAAIIRTVASIDKGYKQFILDTLGVMLEDDVGGSETKPNKEAKDENKTDIS